MYGRDYIWIIFVLYKRDSFSMFSFDVRVAFLFLVVFFVDYKEEHSHNQTSEFDNTT
jgi:hypothetical protein